MIAEHYDAVSVLFADIVGFTARSAVMAAAEVVALLDQVFSAFDRLADAAGVEKIKTIGDAYMVVGGLPEPRPDHLAAVARTALAMREEIARIAAQPGQGWLAVRIGIDFGTGGRRSDRPAQVHLRPLGRHREHGEPDGVLWAARRDPGDRASGRRARPGVRACGRAARSRSREKARWRPSCSTGPMRLRRRCLRTRSPAHCKGGASRSRTRRRRGERSSDLVSTDGVAPGLCRQVSPESVMIGIRITGRLG